MLGSNNPIPAIGLMSGTSADGVDAALVRTNGEAQFEFIDAVTIPYHEQLRHELLEVARADPTLNEILQVERRVTEQHVAACRVLLDRTPGCGPQIIGFHGHTIRHNPSDRMTWQIGDASRLANAMDCAVVSDFRRRDIAAGGHGAPLVPLFHQQMLADIEKPTLVLNLGGVANITWLGENGAILAGDTGPGCGLLDAWTRKHTGESFDRNGELSAAGQVDKQLVETAMRQSFFKSGLPRSADRFQFEIPGIERLALADGAATLCAITAAGVASVLDQLPEQPRSVWITGGGSLNPVIVSMLRDRLGFARPIEDLGLRSDSLEAECFAWLAVRRLRGLYTSLPETTGCEQPTCGGILTS